MNTLTKTLIALHGKEGLSAEQWCDLMLDDVLTGFGLPFDNKLEGKTESLYQVLFDLSEQYAYQVMANPPFTNILGGVYTELVNRYEPKDRRRPLKSRAFCRLMAQLLIADNSFVPSYGRLKRIAGPAVGGGDIVLSALADICEQNGPEALECVSVTGIDDDRRSVRMLVCQVLSTLYLYDYTLGELIAYEGNSLDPIDAWQTICHVTRGAHGVLCAPTG